MKNLNVLLPRTQAVLSSLINNADFLKNYVLVGGTALAMHLAHRQSEDLDFFTYEERFNLQEILDLIHKFTQTEIINRADEQIDLLINSVKVTFFNAKWQFLKPKKAAVFNLASLDDISSMKVHTLFLRAKYRDYYDLYILCKKLGLKRIFNNSKKILPELNFKLFATALIYIDDIEDDNIDHLSPIEEISTKGIQHYFEEQLNAV
ncbi:MAG: hypothetical protein A3F18_06705 [Legionellales bacterium RIFCSPHIGHO2_12_FULL_37_14]|nr:MAG: hypothetical protein A3F18_06705 [Legionellales bacterium RIFCSPHIGHO2_12_FULL_37_14]